MPWQEKQYPERQQIRYKSNVIFDQKAFSMEIKKQHDIVTAMS